MSNSRLCDTRPKFCVKRGGESAGQQLLTILMGRFNFLSESHSGMVLLVCYIIERYENIILCLKIDTDKDLRTRKSHNMFLNVCVIKEWGRCN